MNKKAQFFLIASVLLGTLILSLGTISNTMKSSESSKQFTLVCENYYYEIQQLSRDCLNDECDFKTELQDFTNSFLENKKDIQLIYWYGNQEDFDEETFNDAPSNAWEHEIPIAREYNTFHFIMRKEKGGEVYFCEK